MTSLVNRPYVHFSRFQLTPSAGGGCRRELQLARILSPLNFQFISAWGHQALSTKLRLKMFFTKNNRHHWDPEFRSYAEQMNIFSQRWAGRINSKIKLAILDDPLFFPSLAKVLKIRKIPFIILSQNLESLSRSQINPLFQMELLKKELMLMSPADMIVTISREETFLLDNLGLPTFYLPYYPVKEIEKRMMKIRESRRETTKGGILLMGTINNRVTKEGIHHMIQHWKDHLARNLDEKLIIAGYGTEKIKSFCSGPGIQFKGQLSDMQLDRLLTEISLCLSFQDAGSGALTKIREMHIAGVPVAANTQSARSHYHQPGLVEFNHLSHIESAMVRAKEWEGKIPVPPRPQESEFLKAVEALCRRYS